MTEPKQKISFSQDTQGNHWIKVNDDEVKLNISSLDQEARQVIIRGVSNILGAIACYMST